MLTFPEASQTQDCFTGKSVGIWTTFKVMPQCARLRISFFQVNFQLHLYYFFELSPEVFLLATAHGMSLVMHGTLAALLSVAPLPSVATQLNPNLSAVQMIPGSPAP